MVSPSGRRQKVPINVVGSSTFGIYPKISPEKTYNCFISDDWLISGPGWQKIIEIFDGEGRGIYIPPGDNYALVVIASAVYKVLPNLSYTLIGNLDTSNGSVVMAGNLSEQICLVDGEAAYIYNDGIGTLTKQTIQYLGNDIIPNYVSYHNTFFLISSREGSINDSNWYAFEVATPTTIQFNSVFIVETKPDVAQAVIPLPGRGSNVLVLGTTVGEFWTQVGGADNYRKIQSQNIDSGVVSVSTIASNKHYVCWLSQNESNTPVIMYTNGLETRQISTDGIDHLMQSITRPDKSKAFFYELAGHLFYQITFYDEQDNLSLVYDFKADKFYHGSDADLNYHPAVKVVYFANKLLFISLNNGGIYEMSLDYVTYNESLDSTQIGDEIPRIRICGTIRRQDGKPFRGRAIWLLMEQGYNDIYLQMDNPLPGYTPPRVDLSMSYNGGATFGGASGESLFPQGRHINEVSWEPSGGLGWANEFTPQFRFWGIQRFVVNNAEMEIIE